MGAENRGAGICEDHCSTEFRNRLETVALEAAEPGSAVPPRASARLSLSGGLSLPAEGLRPPLCPPCPRVPGLSLTVSPYLLPASPFAPSVFFSPSKTRPVAARAPKPCRCPSPSPRVPASPGLPPPPAASGRPCRRPSPGPHSPATRRCWPRRLRAGARRGRRCAPPPRRARLPGRRSRQGGGRGREGAGYPRARVPAPGPGPARRPAGWAAP